LRPEGPPPQRIPNSGILDPGSGVPRSGVDSVVRMTSLRKPSGTRPSKRTGGPPPPRPGLKIWVRWSRCAYPLCDLFGDTRRRRGRVPESSAHTWGEVPHPAGPFRCRQKRSHRGTHTRHPKVALRMARHGEARAVAADECAWKGCASGGLRRAESLRGRGRVAVKQSHPTQRSLVLPDLSLVG